VTEHEEQQLPTPNDGSHIHDLVAKDVWHDGVAEDHQGRKRLGTERYGTPLQADNGRDALRDAYEEALDLSVYLRQAIEERNLQLEDLRERLENAVPDNMSTGDRKGVVDAVMELVLPFMVTPTRSIVVRWHDATGETWPIIPGKTMQFPGGVGAFSLTVGAEKVEPPTPSPVAEAADAAWEAFTSMDPSASEPDLGPVHDALGAVDEAKLDVLLGMTETLRTAIVQRKRVSVLTQLRMPNRPRISTTEGE
jgi:hypothetical protein